MDYHWNAEDYAKSSSAQKKWADELIKKLQLNGMENLLDVGCGDGKITAQLDGLMPHGNVTGIDSSEDYEIWLRATGFRVLRAELIPKNMVHENPSRFAAWIRTTWLPYLDRIPSRLRETLVQEILQNYLEDHPADESGCTHAEMIRLEVEALK